MFVVKNFCCGLNLKHGTIIIGVVNSILSFIAMILSAAYAENPHELLNLSDPSIIPDTTVLKTVLIIIATTAALQCGFSILLIFGAETNRPVLLMPWLSLKPITFLFYVICTLTAIIHHSSDNNVIFILSHLIISICLTFLITYKFLIVFNYYKHLRSLNF